MDKIRRYAELKVGTLTMCMSASSTTLRLAAPSMTSHLDLDILQTGPTEICKRPHRVRSLLAELSTDIATFHHRMEQERFALSTKRKQWSSAKCSHAARMGERAGAAHDLQIPFRTRHFVTSRGQTRHRCVGAERRACDAQATSLHRMHRVGTYPQNLQIRHSRTHKRSSTRCHRRRRSARTHHT